MQHGSVFLRLLTDGIDEINRRHPSYLSRHAVSVRGLRDVASEYASLDRFSGVPIGTLERIADETVAHLEERGVALDRSAPVNAIGRVMLETALDAFAAERGGLPLRPSPRPPVLEAILESDYERRVADADIPYFVRRRGTHPLVVTTATGIAGSVWERLLADDSHAYRIIVVETRASDYVRGGMRPLTSVYLDASDIEAVMNAERLDRMNVLGWCNGCSIAIELAARAAERVESVVLLSPTLWESSGRIRCSDFQEHMHSIFAAVARKPELAPVCAAMLKEEAEKKREPALSAAEIDMATLFSLPDARRAHELAAPTSSAADLVHYSQRMMFDATYEAASQLGALTTPVLVVTGTHDHIASNAHTAQTLKTIAPAATCASISGAGHYIQDLQYPYLRWLLDEFFFQRNVPASSARMRVHQRVGGTAGVTIAGVAVDSGAPAGESRP